MPSSHQALREGEATWSHRLPPSRVVYDRIDWCAEATRGRSVAHLGFADIGCEISRERDGNWLHGLLAERAERVVGLDIAESGVQDAIAKGYEAYAVDCTDPEAVAALRLGGFDVVLAGELIEHVDNPGGLLEAAKKLLAPGGELILSTPNARRLLDVIQAAGRREVLHPDHVGIYSARTLTALLERHDWRVAELLVYLNPRSTGSIQGIKHMVMRAAHELERVLAATTSPFVADGLIVKATLHADSP